MMHKKQQAQPPAESQTPSSSTTDPILDLKSQQRLLDIYAAAFSEVLSSDNLTETVQEIKQALFNRDFAAAFGKSEYLEAYAARWSPTRALCYASIFQGLEGLIFEVIQAAGNKTRCSREEDQDDSAAPTKLLRMLCIGGCAAEHVAFASLLQSHSLHGDLMLLDSGPWSSVSHKLQHHITSPPVLSRYASEAARAANHAFISPSLLELRIEQHDVLSLPEIELERLAGRIPIIVTMLFTLNELYTEGGIGKTTKFLGSLGRVLVPGSLLLVVDSPGSYSEAAVGKEKKRYPMHWLLDHTLLQKSPRGVSWEKLESRQSVWFRLPDGLSYPITLENMRYQLHLYRKNEEKEPGSEMY